MACVVVTVLRLANTDCGRLQQAAQDQVLNLTQTLALFQQTAAKASSATETSYVQQVAQLQGQHQAALQALEASQHNVAALESALQDQTAAGRDRDAAYRELKARAAEGAQREQEHAAIESLVEGEMADLRREMTMQQQASESQRDTVRQQHVAEIEDLEERHQAALVQRDRAAQDAERALRQRMDQGAQEAAAGLARLQDDHQMEAAQLRASLTVQQDAVATLTAQLAAADDSMTTLQATCDASGEQLEQHRQTAEAQRRAAELAAEQSAADAAAQRNTEKAAAAQLAQAEGVASELRSAVVDLRRQLGESEERSRRGLAALRTQAADDAMQVC